MTTFESFKKFGIGPRCFIGGVMMVLGGVFTVLALVVTIVDRVTGNFGLDGEMLLIFLLIFLGLGIGMAFFGSRMYFREKKQVDGLREAYENNRCIMADIVDIHKQTSSQETSNNMFTGVSYRDYYVIECRYKDPATGKTHIYYSPGLYFDPTGLITAKQVPVYIDKNNEENFFVDIYKALEQVEVH